MAKKMPKGLSSLKKIVESSAKDEMSDKKMMKKTPAKTKLWSSQNKTKKKC